MPFAPSPVFCRSAAPAEGTGGRLPAHGRRCPRSASRTATGDSGCWGPGRKHFESRKAKEASPRPPLPARHGTASGPRQEPSRGCSPCAAAAVLGVQGVSRLAGRRLIQPLPGWPRALKASRNVLATAPARSGGWHGRLAESPTL